MDCIGCDQGIVDLAIGPDSTLYIAQEFRGLLIKEATGAESSRSGMLDGVTVTPDGAIFVLDRASFTPGNVLQVVDTGYINFNTADDGLEVSTFYDITADTSGIIWIGCDLGLISFDGETFELKAGLDRAVFNVVQTNTGDIWVRPSNAHPARWTGTEFESTNDRFPPTLFQLDAFDVADEGVLWGSSSLRGIFIDDFSGTEATQVDATIYGFEDASPFIRRILVDAKNRIWMTGDFGFALKLEKQGSTTSLRDPLAEAQPLQIFPNPARETVQITLPQSISRASEVELRIYDLTGKPVLERTIAPSQGQQNLTLHDWPPGVYHILLRQQNNYWRSKLLHY